MSQAFARDRPAINNWRVIPPEVQCPFTPRSNRNLLPGQFWAIPLLNGRFAVGRVMAVPAFGAKDRVGVVVGLMDWSGSREPTESDLAGRKILAQGQSRYEAISKTGGQLLGLRALELDGLFPSIQLTCRSVRFIRYGDGERSSPEQKGPSVRRLVRPASDNSRGLTFGHSTLEYDTSNPRVRNFR